jgi:hypothetical protein
VRPRTRGLGALLAVLALAACGGDTTSGGGGPPPGGSGPAVGGSVSGLGSGKNVTLQMNGTDTVTRGANGPYSFPDKVPSGFTYAVAVLIQPVGQTCAVANPSGTVGSVNVTNIAVTCSSNQFTVGGTVTGLTGSGTLQNNGANTIPLANGPFTFSAPIADSAAYAVTVSVQPAGQTCTVNNGSGTVSAANVANVAVTCGASAFAVGGTLTGLAGGTAVVLQNNRGDNLNLTTDGAFAFTTPVASGAAYSVGVLTQPAGQGCSVALGTGTIAGADVTGVDVSCTANSFTVGGTVSGLSGTLVLRNNNGDDLSLFSNGPFTFATAILTGSTHAVTVQSKPAAQTCLIVNANGPVNANVTNVAVTCGVPDFIPANLTFAQVNGLNNPLFATVSAGNAGTVTSAATTATVRLFSDDACGSAPVSLLTTGIGAIAPSSVGSFVTPGALVPPGTYLSQSLTVEPTADEIDQADNSLCRTTPLEVQ